MRTFSGIHIHFETNRKGKKIYELNFEESDKKKKNKKKKTDRKQDEKKKEIRTKAKHDDIVEDAEGEDVAKNETALPDIGDEIDDKFEFHVTPNIGDEIDEAVKRLSVLEKKKEELEL